MFQPNPTQVALACLLLFATGCGGVDNPLDENPPSAELLEEATQSAIAGKDLADLAKTALEMLGILPTYECGEPRGTFVGRIADQLELDHPCVTVTTAAVETTADSITLDFPPQGCPIRGHTLVGQAIFYYSGGEDRMDVSVDLRGLEVDGQALNSQVGYGTCGDSQHVWAEGFGALTDDIDFEFAITLALREGIPIFGSSTLVLDGTAKLQTAEAIDQVTFQELEYEPGSVLPKSGSLTVDTVSGHHIVARFSSELFYNKVEITVDDHDPVTVPIP